MKPGKIKKSVAASRAALRAQARHVARLLNYEDFNLNEAEDDVRALVALALEVK